MKKYRKKEYIPTKANRVLQWILLGLLIIILKVWHLAIVQHEERLALSKKPQKKVVLKHANRGTIRDRFNIPLAINKVQYNAAVVYSEIRELPSSEERKAHVSALAQLLADQLHLDPSYIEDLIYSKAALYQSLPFVIQEGVSEADYYRLKFLEKDWVGLRMQSVPVRAYPQEKVAADIVGYLGAISQNEYEQVFSEIRQLQKFLQNVEVGEEESLPDNFNSIEEVETRLTELMERAYTINDSIGKTGIESRYEEQLRGYQGKNTYASNARGIFLSDSLEKTDPLPGRRILLTISSELQAFAEKLLIQNEQIRKCRVTSIQNSDRKWTTKVEPWIKGGAIIAFEPKTGDVLALASYPRFNPNDFIRTGSNEEKKEKNRNIQRWFESVDYLGGIWDQRYPLSREVYHLDSDSIEEEHCWIDWEEYLNRVLPEESALRKILDQRPSISDVQTFLLNIQKLRTLTINADLYATFNLMYTSPFHHSHGPRLPAVEQEALEEVLDAHEQEIAEIRQSLAPYFSSLAKNYDKVLLIDLFQLVVNPKMPIPRQCSHFSLSQYRQATAAKANLSTALRALTQELFREKDFKVWREKHQRAFLRQKRLEEKERGIRYPKPYLDLLKKEEKKQFSDFWETYANTLILYLLTGKSSSSNEALLSYFQDLKIWHDELSQGAHSELEWYSHYWTLRNFLTHVPSIHHLYLLQTFREFSDLNTPLHGRYRHVRKTQGQQLQKDLAIAFYPLYGYGYGRSHAYRQATTQGSIFKIVTGYEALIQHCRKIKNTINQTSLLNPQTIIDDTHKRGGQTYIGMDASGRPIPQYYKGGRLPRSHRTGIGKVDLLKAYEVSSNPYFSLLAANHLEDPNDLSAAAESLCFGSRTGIDLPAEIPGRVPNDLDCNRSALYAMAIGQHSLVVTPLQTAVMLSTFANGGSVLKPKIVSMTIGNERNGHESCSITTEPTTVKREIELPKQVQNLLLKGMERVTKKTQTHLIESLGRIYDLYPEAIHDLISMENDLIGKSSTSESVESVNLDLEQGTNIYNHPWFGGVVYPEGRGGDFSDPELVIIIYLRYGSWGKDAIPLAAQVASKWREIKKQHTPSNVLPKTPVID